MSMVKAEACGQPNRPEEKFPSSTQRYQTLSLGRKHSLKRTQVLGALSHPHSEEETQGREGVCHQQNPFIFPGNEKLVLGTFALSIFTIDISAAGIFTLITNSLQGNFPVKDKIVKNKRGILKGTK